MDNPDPELNTRFANWNKDKHIVPKIKECFVNHGARPVETSHLQVAGCQNLYGSSCSRRIVPLKNGTGDKEQVCLRFDHTMQMGKMVGSGKLQHTKVYQMGPVFRLYNGKCVEEYKCDYDIMGSHEPMIPDSECIQVIFSILTSQFQFNTQKVMIRVSHCRLLTGIMTHCGVPLQLQPVVRNMLMSHTVTVEIGSLVEAGLSREVATFLFSYLVKRGGSKLLAELRSDVGLMTNQDAQKGIEDLELLFLFCQAFRVSEEVLTLDISFVRELDYYTGVVFEALLLDEDNEPYKCLACGGRYDNLIGNLQGGGVGVPAVGFSINVDPICEVLSTVGEFSEDFLQDPEESTDESLLAPEESTDEFFPDPEESTDESLPAPEESTDEGLKGHASLETGIQGEGKQTEQEGTEQLMVTVVPPPCQDLQHESTEEQRAPYSDVGVQSSLPLQEEGPHQPAHRVFGLSHRGPPTLIKEKREHVIMSGTPGKTIKYPMDPESLLVLQKSSELLPE